MKVCYFFHGVLFSLSDWILMEIYSRVYFSLCLFLVISVRSLTQRKLNPHKNFPICGITKYYETEKSLDGEYIV